jgi:hypothetical protein
MKTNPFSKHAIMLAREIGKSEGKKYVLRKSEELAEEAPEFKELTDDIIDSHHLREETKIKIISEIYHDWIKGKYKEAHEIHDKLFDPEGRETFIPSDVE